MVLPPETGSLSLCDMLLLLVVHVVTPAVQQPVNRVVLDSPGPAAAAVQPKRIGTASYGTGSQLATTRLSAH